jgi:hypothetical protein
VVVTIGIVSMALILNVFHAIDIGNQQKGLGISEDTIKETGMLGVISLIAFGLFFIIRCGVNVITLCNNMFTSGMVGVTGIISAVFLIINCGLVWFGISLLAKGIKRYRIIKCHTKE